MMMMMMTTITISKCHRISERTPQYMASAKTRNNGCYGPKTGDKDGQFNDLAMVWRKLTTGLLFAVCLISLIIACLWLWCIITVYKSTTRNEVHFILVGQFLQSVIWLRLRAVTDHSLRTIQAQNTWYQVSWGSITITKTNVSVRIVFLEHCHCLLCLRSSYSQSWAWMAAITEVTNQKLLFNTLFGPRIWCRLLVPHTAHESFSFYENITANQPSTFKEILLTWRHRETKSPKENLLKYILGRLAKRCCWRL